MRLAGGIAEVCSRIDRSPVAHIAPIYQTFIALPNWRSHRLGTRLRSSHELTPVAVHSTVRRDDSTVKNRDREVHAEFVRLRATLGTAAGPEARALAAPAVYSTVEELDSEVMQAYYRIPE